jgi:hypothetical protein
MRSIRIDPMMRAFDQGVAARNHIAVALRGSALRAEHLRVTAM